MKYILQNVNVFNGEVLGVMDYGDYENTMSCIQHYEEVEKNRDNQSMLVLKDKDDNLWDAEYITYVIDKEREDEDIIVYNALFKVELT